MRFKNMPIEMEVIITENGALAPYISGRATHPVGCYGKPDISFHKIFLDETAYQSLFDAALTAGHGGRLRIHITGEVELGNVPADNWRSPSYQHALVVEQICSIYQVK